MKEKKEINFLIDTRLILLKNYYKGGWKK